MMNYMHIYDDTYCQRFVKQILAKNNAHNPPGTAAKWKVDKRQPKITPAKLRRERNFFLSKSIK